MSEVRIVEGDCFEVLGKMADESVHAVVTDPPYGLEFMGAEWDAPWQASSSSKLFGDRATGMPGWTVTRNPTCRTCKGRLRGANRCECATPAWDEATNATFVRQMHALQEWNGEWLSECLRVLKPGGFLLAFSGTRTYHRLACAAEDVGFEVRDMIEWFYGSGFPKSKDVSTAIDEHLGKADEREVVGQKHADRYPNGPGGTSFTVNGDGADGTRTAERTVETRAASEEAAKYEGWGTALKPAHEPILLARKPPASTIARNFLEHGTGGLNIDAARIPSGDDDLGGGDELASPRAHGEGWSRPWHDDPELLAAHAERVAGNVEKAESLGRWPANVILTHSVGCVLLGTRKVRGDGNWAGSTESVGYEGGWDTTDHPRDRRVPTEEVVEVYECEVGCPVAELDRQSGDLKAGGKLKGDEPSQPFGGSVYGDMRRSSREWAGYGDKGGASRFFYVAKASRAERNAGLEDLEPQPLNWSSGTANPGSFQSVGTERNVRNHHPTVKPIMLMRHLLRLVVPPDGVALDPFLGSGTTACAAALEDVALIGIERDPGFVDIAKRRHEFWAEHGDQALEEMRRRETVERVRQEVEEAGQLGLFG